MDCESCRFNSLMLCADQCAEDDDREVCKLCGERYEDGKDGYCNYCIDDWMTKPNMWCYITSEPYVFEDFLGCELGVDIRATRDEEERKERYLLLIERDIAEEVEEHEAEMVKKMRHFCMDYLEYFMERATKERG